MFSFPCASCSQPSSIAELHSWVFGAPFCSERCASEVGERYDAPPEAIGVIHRTCTLLSETGELVRRAIPVANSAELSFDTNAMLGSDLLILPLGLFPLSAARAVSGAASDSSEDMLTTYLWDIDQRLHRIIREMMVLEGLGFEVAQHLVPFVQNFGTMSGPTPSGSCARLRHLYEYLGYLYNGVSGLSYRTTRPS